MPHTQKDTHGQIIIMGPNARKNNDGPEQSHDVSGSESTPMDTPNVTTVPIAKNQVIPESDIYDSETTGAVSMKLKKMPGALKNAMILYLFYCNEKRLLVSQMYPDRSKSVISKMMSAQ